jgi:sigma-B regulation protein RsbU (phosphoserine phosphatase)
MIDDDHLCFVIGDVSGKGIPASLFMAVTRTLLRSVAVKKLTPADIVTKLNKSLSANNESCMFVTFFLGIIDINTGETQYTNAGHNPFIHISEDQVNYRKVNPAMVLGAFEDAVFTNERMTLKKNDMILMYTDGVTEAMDHDEKLFGEKRLLELLKDSDSWTVKQVISNTMNGIAEFVKDNEQSDDITMLVLKYLS